MRSRMRRSNRFRDLIIFWAMVLICSVVLAGLAFIAGKYWVGGLIARSKSGDTAPKIIVQTPDDEPQSGADDRVTEPPSKAVVKMQERAPTEAERSEIEQTYPQDGAQLNKETGAEPEDTSTGSSTKALNDDSPPDGNDEYLVTAGSYASAANADREVADLLKRGYSPFVVKAVKDGKTYHRVSLGPYSTRKEAVRVRDKLTTQGKAASIVRR